jgi:hypothetical protein
MDVLERVRSLKPEPRPELTAAFEAAGDTAAQVILILPKYARRVIEETLPELPKELGGGPSSVVTRGFQWAAVGIDFPPKPALRLVVQAQDGPAAQAFQAKAVEWLGRVMQLKEVREYLPKPDEILTLVTPKVEGSRLVLTLDEENQGITKAMVLLTPPAEYVRVRASEARAANQLKQLALAMHMYHDGHKQFPLPATVSADKKPLLSWRVQILPYLGQKALYDQFKLDEPWDSPHNRALVEKMPEVYRQPGSKKGNGWTHYVLPVGSAAGFSMEKPTRFQEIRDGTSNTLMILEADDAHAVIWTKPEDWSFDPKDPFKGLGRNAEGGFRVVFFDGSVRMLPATIKPKTLGELITPSGGEVTEY